jgi:hypothetical protein
MTNTRQLNTPETKLPRSAERAGHVWQAHQGQDASLDARGEALAPARDQFVALGNALHDAEEHAQELRQQRDVAVADLQATKRRWLPSLQRDVPGFDTSGFTDSDVPEDSVSQSRELRHRFAGRIRGGAAPAYAAEVSASLEAAEQRVEAAVQAVYDADTRVQQASDEHHAAAHRLDRELVAFRAVARSVLGSSHRDYRKLLNRRGGVFEETLEPDEPEQPTGSDGGEPAGRASTGSDG